MIFWQIYKKEWRENAFLWMLLTGLTVVFVLLTYSGHITKDLYGLPFALGIFVFLIFNITILKKEENYKTSFLLKSLPVPGWVVILAKVFWLFSSFLLYYFIWTIASWQHIYRQHFQLILDTQNLTLDILLITILPLLTIVLMQFAHLAAYYVSRFRGFVSIWIFAISGYITIRLSTFLGRVLRFLPSLAVYPKTYDNAGIYFVNSGILVALAIITVILLLINGKLWDNTPSI